MNKLSKEKTNHLILVGLLTVGTIAGLWFGLISAQNQKIKEISDKIHDTQQQIDRVQSVVVGANQVDSSLKVSLARLNEIELGMPSGDLYLWMLRTIQAFNMPGYKVTVPTIGLPVTTSVSMLPNYPYNQAAAAVNGSAYYTEFGKFLADFENHFPYMRVQNLGLEPTPGGTKDEDRERLSFHMEIVSLVKTNSF